MLVLQFSIVECSINYNLGLVASNESSRHLIQGRFLFLRVRPKHYDLFEKVEWYVVSNMLCMEAFVLQIMMVIGRLVIEFGFNVSTIKKGYTDIQEIDRLFLWLIDYQLIFNSWCYTWINRPRPPFQLCIV